MSSSAKNDVSALHPDTRTFRGQSAHCRIERNLSRSSNDVWMVVIRMATPLAVGYDVARGDNRSMAHELRGDLLKFDSRA